MPQTVRAGDPFRYGWFDSIRRLTSFFLITGGPERREVPGVGRNAPGATYAAMV